MLDSYQSEKGSTSSLYESLFNQVFEVPSFLTDDSDEEKTRLDSMIEVYVCRRLLDSETAKRYWRANELCGQIINNNIFINLISDYLVSESKSKNDNFISEIIKQFLSLIIKLDGCIKNEIDSFKTNIEIDTNIEIIFSQVSYFIRDILILFLSCSEIEEVIIKSDFIKDLDEKKYLATHLNIFYLYLLHDNKV